MNNIRVGKISSIDYENGMARVVYSDKENAVTTNFPMISNGEYQMPEIGQSVLVLHLSNGSSRGIVIGTFWNQAYRPLEGRKGIYHKELSKTTGKAIIQYDEATEKITIKAPFIELNDGVNKISLNDLLRRIEGLESRIEALESRERV